jgi:hypothetical protein
VALHFVYLPAVEILFVVCVCASLARITAGYTIIICYYFPENE